MKQADVKLGGFYDYKRKGELVRVRIVRQFLQAYVALDVKTGRNVYISSARRLREIDA